MNFTLGLKGKENLQKLEKISHRDFKLYNL
jgi:hypothetical protein